MFVASVKTTRLRLFAVIGGCILLLAVLLILSGRQAASTAAAIPDLTDPVAYLNRLGYEVDEEAATVREIRLPEDFDKTLTAYNAMLTAAGTDLSALRGKRLKYWTFPVTNYPDPDGVEAHLYLYKEKIVGGDLASVRADGFRQALTALTAEKG